MKVKILRIIDGSLVDAFIKEGQSLKLPSLQEGWRFNFAKHSKAKETYTYALVTDQTPTIIEGCLIYKMKNNYEPYMAFVEIAEHNQGDEKKYDYVAGCLIAYASQLSFELGEGPYKGWLAFDVQEETTLKQNKLMAHYSKKFKAQRIANTTMMYISPEDGEDLIEEYLDR